MRKRCYCGNSEGASERGLFAATRTRGETPFQLKFRREELFPAFLLLTPSSKGIRGRERDTGLRFRFCTLQRHFEGAVFSCSLVSAHHVMVGKEGNFSYPFTLHTPSLPPTPPTNKRRECHSPKKTSGRIRNFFVRPATLRRRRLSCRSLLLFLCRYSVTRRPSLHGAATARAGENGCHCSRREPFSTDQSFKEATSSRKRTCPGVRPPRTPLSSSALHSQLPLGVERRRRRRGGTPRPLYRCGESGGRRKRRIEVAAWGKRRRARAPMATASRVN